MFNVSEIKFTDKSSKSFTIDYVDKELIYISDNVDDKGYPIICDDNIRWYGIEELIKKLNVMSKEIEYLKSCLDYDKARLEGQSKTIKDLLDSQVELYHRIGKLEFDLSVAKGDYSIEYKNSYGHYEMKR